MELIALILLIFVGAVGISVHSGFQARKRLRAGVRDGFGKVPDGEGLDFKSISTYYALGYESEHAAPVIDDVTWNDLDMDRVFARINGCFSSVGEEYLYDCLRRPQFEQENLLGREKLVEFFDENPEKRFETAYALARLGKEDFNGITPLIYCAEFKMLGRPWVYNILACVPLLCAALFAFSVVAGLAGVFLSFLLNYFVYRRAMKIVNVEAPAIGYFAAMMKCCKRLLKTENPALSALQKPYDVFRKAISKAPTKRTVINDDMAEAFWVYFSIMFLYDVRHYNNFMKTVTGYKKEFHTIYQTLGEVDTALSVLNFRQSLPEFCTPVFHAENALDFDEIFHPLIPEPVANSAKIDRNALLTGSNASGKSTFIKTLAINGILAQTVFTCTARRFATRFALVITSMALRDNLFGGESYFVVEIKSMKRILDMVKKRLAPSEATDAADAGFPPCVCYIDEILRGTNTVERVAASAAVLGWLENRDCLCIAASHDIELTRMLNHANYHFREHVTDSGVEFDYKLKNGPSATRNAIKLLETMDFDSEIIEKAFSLTRA